MWADLFYTPQSIYNTVQYIRQFWATGSSASGSIIDVMCRSTNKSIIHRQLFYKLFYKDILHIEVIDLYFGMEFMTF